MGDYGDDLVDRYLEAYEDMAKGISDDESGLKEQELTEAMQEAWNLLDGGNVFDTSSGTFARFAKKLMMLLIILEKKSIAEETIEYLGGQRNLKGL